MNEAVEDLKFYIENKFPLIKLQIRTKIPVEKWRDTELRDRPAEMFVGNNWGVKLGTMFNGKYLTVVDVDPKNGGFESFATLERAYGSLQGTLKVRTGSGGFHLYFLSAKPLPKCRLAAGIDFLCVGSYVVGAGSTHENGNRYEFEVQDEMLDLPDFFYEMDAVKIAVGEGSYLNTSKDSKEDPEVVPEGERDNWLVRKAGQMRRLGLGEQTILEGLREFNLKCKPPKDEVDLKRIANSVSKYKADSVDELVVRTIEVPKEQEKIELQNETPIIKQLNELYATAPGLIKEIADEILTHAKRPYPHFAMASALGIISGVVQGSFYVPNLDNPKVPDGGLALYQWLTSPPGSGKNAYLKAVETYLPAVDKRLLASKLGSSYGLRGSLYCFNSVVSCVDEMQDEMTRLNAVPGSAAAQVLTDFKELFNDLKELRPVIVKGSKFPSILSPRLGVFSVGTTDGFKKLLSGDMIGGGLLSRFIHWPEAPVSDFHYGATENFDAPAKHVTQLKELFEVGLTSIGYGQDYDKVFDDLAKINDKKNGAVPKHQPQTLPTMVVDIDQDAVAVLKDFRASQDVLYKRLVRDGLASSEVSPASIVARSPQMAAKFATLAALSELKLTINREDAEFGVRLSYLLSQSLQTIIGHSGGDDPRDKAKAKILETLSKANEGVSHRFLMRYTHLRREILRDALVDLFITGQVLPELADGKLVDLEKEKTIPRGCKFRLP